MMNYRPWGEMQWLLARAKVKKWGLVSCIGAEERALSAQRVLRDMGLMGEAAYLDINNPVYQHSLEFEHNKAKIRKSFENLGGRSGQVFDFSLMGSTHDSIVSFAEAFPASLGDSVILDVSTMPKRFSFPIIRRLIAQLTSGELTNLIVSYGVPLTYAPGKLAWNHDDWGHLPLFQGRYSRRRIDKIVASIGFETLGLTSQLEEGKEASGEAVLLLPFPSPLRWVNRCWDTVEKIVRARGGDSCKVVCCDARDVSQAFDQMEIIGNYGARELILAPYGPKPHSIAMALFASKYDYPVFYTQPKHYHPSYSYGVQTIGGSPYCVGYVLGVEGRYLYK